VWYYLAIVFNGVTRCLWLFYFLMRQFAYTADWVAISLPFIEICRRFVWNIFRVENEHVTNVGDFRAVHDVPLPFKPLHDPNEKNDKKDQQVTAAQQAAHDNDEDGALAFCVSFFYFANHCNFFVAIKIVEMQQKGHNDHEELEIVLQSTTKTSVTSPVKNKTIDLSSPNPPSVMSAEESDEEDFSNLTRVNTELDE